MDGWNDSERPRSGFTLQASWKLWGDLEILGPLGQGSSDRTLLGNFHLLLPLGIAFGWAVLSRSHRTEN